MRKLLLQFIFTLAHTLEHNRGKLMSLPLLLVLILLPLNLKSQSAISLSLDSIKVEILAGDKASQSLTIENTGNEDLSYSLSYAIEAYNEVTFTKVDYSEWTHEKNQDRVSDSVWITRANSQGIFNFATDSSYTSNSPYGTEWSYGYSKDLSPEDYVRWVSAIGSYPPGMVDKPLSMHLIEDDIYLDIVFHQWTAGGNGGGFSYTRKPAYQWVKLFSGIDTILQNESNEVELEFDASNLQVGKYSMDLIISTNDPLNPEIIFPVKLIVSDAAAVIVDSDTLDFGLVFLGVTDTLQLTVQNGGTEDLLLSSIDISNSAYSISPTFAGLNPGESKIFNVIFEPDAVGDFAATLTLNSNDPTDPEYIVALDGSGANPPVIALTPDSLKVSLLANDSTSKVINIGNTGESVLNYEIQFLTSSTESKGTSAISWSLLATDPKESSDINIFDIKNVYGAISNDKVLIKLESYEPINMDSSNPDYIEILIDIDQDGNTGFNLNDYYNLNLGVEYVLAGFDFYKFENEDFLTVENNVLYQIEEGSKEVIVSFDQAILGDVSAINIGVYTNYDLVPDGNLQYIEFPFTVPWLNTETLVGEIAAGTDKDITVEFNAKGMFDGDYKANISVFSNDPVQPVADIIASLHVTGFATYSGPANINLGTTFIGYADSAYLVIENTGSKNLDISNILSGDARVTTKTTDLSIPPLGTDSISFTLLNDTEGEFSSTITFNTTDANASEVSLELLSITFAAPELSLSKENISVSIEESSSANETFTVTNAGGYYLNYNISFQQNMQAIDFSNSYSEIYLDQNLTPSSGVTLSLWINLLEDLNCDGNNNWRSLISKGIAMWDFSGFDVIVEEDGAFVWSLALENGLMRYSAGTLPVDEWVFASFTYDAATSEAKIFLNGEEVSGSYWENATGAILENYYSLKLNNYTEACQDGFGHVPAQISEVRYWDKALSQEEIVLNMNRSLNGSESGLLGYWPLDEVVDYQVYDKTPYQNYGYVNGEVAEVAIERNTWLTVTPVYGNIASSDPTTINVAFDGAGLDLGVYETDLIISSNDPENGFTKIPISLEVTEAVGIEDKAYGTDGTLKYRSYPNPFSSETFINYELKSDSKVEVTIFNLQGQEVQKLVNQRQSAGIQEVVWNGKNYEDQDAESGVYLCRLDVSSLDGTTSTEYIRLMLIK